MKKIKAKKKKLTTRCSHEGCSSRAKAKHECLTCEKLVEAGKAKTIFAVYACGNHQNEALASIKKHAMVGHPVNILRAIAAQLKGEDVI